MAAAGAGQRVLVVSTDQAHSLGDVLGVPVPPSQAELVRVLADLETGRAEAGGGFLDALALDTLALLGPDGVTWSPPWTGDFPTPS